MPLATIVDIAQFNFELMNVFEQNHESPSYGLGWIDYFDKKQVAGESNLNNIKLII